jgi:hypothetical protein
MHKHFLKRESLADRIHVAQTVLIEQVGRLAKQSWYVLGLYELTQAMVFKATVASIAGDLLTSDECLDAFLAFDKSFPLLFKGVPGIFVSKAIRAREKLVQVFASQEYADSAQTPFIKDGSIEMGKVASPGVPLDFQIRQHMSFVWVSVANSMPGIFWTLYHLLKDRHAYDKCREQVESILAKKKKATTTSTTTTSTSTPLWFTLDELDEMTLLNSVFFETLRLHQVIFSSRVATKDFIYNPKDKERKFMIEKGTQIMACPTLTHRNPDIFDNPNDFQFDRFQDVSVMKNGKPLISYVLAFGGGGHLCSGRKFIAYETQAMLAMMLTRLDLRLLESSDKEEIVIGVDYARQGIGVPPPTSDPVQEYRKRAN